MTRAGAVARALAAAALAGGARAMMPRPGPTSFELAEGCTAELTLHGDGFAQWWTTEEGVLACRVGDSAFRLLDEDGTCSEEPLTCANLAPGAGARGNAKPPEPAVDPKELAEMHANSYAAKVLGGALGGADDSRGAPPVVMKNLVLMIRFADHANNKLPPREEYETLFNSNRPDPALCPTGSVREFYRQQSYGKVEIESVVTDWITVSSTEAAAAENCNGACGGVGLQSAIREGLRLFEASEPELFASLANKNGEVDMFTVIHSGYGAETGSRQPGASNWIWSHRFRFSARWSTPINSMSFHDYFIAAGLWGEEGTSITRLGVVAHEMAHYLGLPDLYDTDNSSLGTGLYGIMADSWGLDRSQYYPGSFSAPMKYALLWLQPSHVILGGSAAAGATITLGSVSSSGDFALLPLNYDVTAEPLPGLSRQDIIIEFRAAELWDSLLPGGMLIWHVDVAGLRGRTPTQLNQNANALELKPYDRKTWATQHYAVRLVQADNLHHLERNVPSKSMDSADWWRNKNQVASDDTISPNLQSYILAAQGVRSGHVLRDFTILADNKASFVYDFDLRAGTLPEPVEPDDLDIGLTPAVETHLNLWTWAGIGGGGMLGAIVAAFVGMVVIRRMRGSSSRALREYEDEYVMHAPTAASPTRFYDPEAAARAKAEKEQGAEQRESVDSGLYPESEVPPPPPLDGDDDGDDKDLPPL